MQTQKPKSIKNVGLTVTIFSGLVVFSNSMSLLMFTLLGFNDYENSEAKDLTSIDYFFDNTQYLLLIIVVLGILFLIGGIQLMKYKLWAKKLLMGTSLLLIPLVTVLLIFGILTVFKDNEMIFVLIPITLIWVVFTLPLVFLIRFLNKKRIQNHLI